MTIIVQGGSQQQKKYVESIVAFCVKKMMPRINNLEIKVVLKNLSKSGAYGYCMSDPEGDASRLDRPRTFEIEVHQPLRLRKLLETVAHEMVHVKQYARGELYQGVRVNKMRWQGKYFNNKISYWDLPWEIEAHGREAGLFIQWAEENKLGNKKWTWDDF